MKVFLFDTKPFHVCKDIYSNFFETERWNHKIITQKPYLQKTKWHTVKNHPNVVHSILLEILQQRISIFNGLHIFSNLLVFSGFCVFHLFAQLNELLAIVIAFFGDLQPGVFRWML